MKRRRDPIINLVRQYDQVTITQAAELLGVTYTRAKDILWVTARAGYLQRVGPGVYALGKRHRLPTDYMRAHHDTMLATAALVNAAGEMDPKTLTGILGVHPKTAGRRLESAHRWGYIDRVARGVYGPATVKVAA